MEEFGQLLTSFHHLIAEKRYEKGFNALSLLINSFKKISVETQESNPISEIVSDSAGKYLARCFSGLNDILNEGELNIKNDKKTKKALTSAQRQFEDMRRRRLLDSQRNNSFTNDTLSNASSERTEDLENLSEEEKHERTIRKSMKLMKLISMAVLLIESASLSTESSGIKLKESCQIFEKIILKTFSEKISLIKGEIVSLKKPNGIQQDNDLSSSIDILSQAVSDLLQETKAFLEEIVFSEIISDSFDSTCKQSFSGKILETAESGLETLASFSAETIEFNKILRKLESLAEDKSPALSNFLSEISIALDYLVFVQQSTAEMKSSLEDLRISSNSFGSAFQSLESEYFQLENHWISSQSQLLLQSDRNFRGLANYELDSDIIVHSSVDHIFFVYKASLFRSMNTGGEHTANAILNIVCHDFEDSLLLFLRKILRPPKHLAKHAELLANHVKDSNDEIFVEKESGTQVDRVPEEDVFSSALDSAITGEATLKSELLYAINSIALAAQYCDELVLILENEYKSRYELSFDRFETTLQSISEAKAKFLSLVDGSISEVFDSCIFRADTLLYQNTKIFFEQLSYSPEQLDVEQAAEPKMLPFLSGFVYCNKSVLKAKDTLSESCFSKLIATIFHRIATDFLDFLLSKDSEDVSVNKRMFSEIGIICLEDDVSSLDAQVNLFCGSLSDNINTECEQISVLKKLEDCLSKLRQICLVLQLPDVDIRPTTEEDRNISDSYGLDHLTDVEITFVLSKKI